jgi:hypothetical protein
MDVFVLRAHSGDTSDSLFHPRRRPWQVEVNHNLRVLEIHTLAQQVCGEQKVNGFGGSRRVIVICTWCEATDRLVSRQCTANYSRTV